MALVVKDRVKESTTTTGTGTISLAGTFPGFQTFVTGVGSTNTTYYAIEDANGTAWEVGLGTVTDASPDTLSRSTILASSTGSAISLSSGTHTVFATYPAGKAVYLDASGNLSHTVDISSDTNLAASTGITLTGDTLTTNDGQIVHDSLSGFVANEHIDHSGVSITAGTGLSGGGDLTSTRTLNVDASQTQITAVGTIATGTWAATDVAVAHGGTGASSAGDARTNLGLVIGTNVQAYDAQLATLAALTANHAGGLVDLATLEAPGSDGQFIVATGSGAFAYESGATARASLGVSIGSDVQAYDADLAALAGVTSAANKIPYFTGSGSADILSLKDEDNMASNSVYAVATQQSIVAYVAAQITAEDLDISTDSGTIDIDLNSETLTIAGGSGISTSGSSTTVTVAIDSTITTLSGSQTLTNKTLTSPIVSGLTLSDSSITLEGATIDGYETIITVTDPTADRTWTIPNATDTSVGRDTTDTLTNKTLTAPNINGAVSGSSISTQSDMDDGSGPSNSLLSSQLAIKTFVDNQISSVANKQTTFVLQDGDGSSVTIADSKYVRFIEGNAIDINWTDTDNGTSGDPYDLTVAVASYTGESSLVTTGALNTGTITSGFGDINTGSSNITTTGLISGGSLDIDNVLINGTNIGHTDDTDLLTLTSGALALLGTFTVGVDDAGHNVQFYGHTTSKYMQWESSSDSLRIYGDLRTQGYLKIFSTDQNDQTLYAKQVASQTGELILMENSSGTDLFVVSSAGVITVGTWQGTKIASGYIANDAIDSQHYAAASIDAEHLAPDIISGQTEVTSADADYLLVWDATDSALKKVDAGEFRGGGGGGSGTMNAVKSNGSAVGGSDIVTLDFSSEFTTSESPDTEINISMAAAQTAITSLGTLTALTVDDIAIDGKVITMTGSTSDTAVFTVGTHGTLSIVTTDAAAAAANIQITADGTVDIDSAGVLTLDSGAAINIEPASGSAILLDGTISIDAGVVTGATSITSTAFVGGITGNVTGNASGTAATVTGGTQAAITSAANLATIGTVTSGTLSTGAVLAGVTVTMGSDAEGDIYYRNASGVLTRLAASTDGHVLTATGAGSAPAWEAASGGGGTPTAITVADESSDTTCFPLFVTAATGDLGPKSGSNLTFNSSTGVLTATGFAGPLTGNVTGNASGSSGSCTGNAATATALASARNINGVAFDGTGNITVTAAGSTLSDTVTVAKGGTGATSLTDGGILLGSGTGAITALAVLGDGVIVVGDNSTDPTTITAFTASDGVLKHEVGGLELDISGIAIGDVLAGTGTGAVGIVTSTGHSDGDVLTLQADGTADWETASSGGMTAFILEDDSGDEVSISNAEEVKFIGAGGLTINWTDTSPGSDGDPFDLTFTIGTLNQDTTGTAAIATTVTITDNEDTNEENAIIFTAGGDVDGGNIGLESDGTMTYNPSTGTVTATIFKGNIDAVDGDFDGTLEADAITLGGTALGSLYSPIAGSSSITTVGTIGTGTWQGTTIAINQGGTGATSLNNLITLSTHTTGNYVATIADAGNSAITVANSGAEGAAITLDIADNAVGIAELAGIARGKIIVGDASGNPALLAAGDEDQVLTIDASGDAVWAASGGGGDITAVVAGTGLSGGATSGSATLNVDAAQSGITSLGTLTALTVDDVAIDGKVITMTGSTNDTAVFTVGTHGTLSIVTTDTAAAAANIQITADGTVDIDSAGVLTLDSGAAINIEPASGSAILLDGTISIDAGVVTGATSITSTAFVGDITGDVTGNADTATVATTVTITDNEDTNEENAVVFTAGGDVDGGNLGLESDGHLTYNPSSGTVTATIFKGNIDAVDGDFDGTLEADAITLGGTALGSLYSVIAGSSSIVTVGTIGTGVWQGTAIAGGYIANDAIDSQHYADGSIDNAHIADDAIDSEHYAAASIDFAHIQNVAANSILGRNANSSGVLSEIALATTQILIGDGTGFTAAALSGDATMTNAGVVSLAANSVDSDQYVDASIDTAHIAADQITSALIADDQIDSEHYAAGSIDTAHIADDQITLAKMASGTDGNIISYDASGNPVAIATGSDGQVLTSTGAGSPPAFEDAGGGASSLDGLTDVTIVGTRNLFIETDGAAPPHSVTGSGQDNLAIGHDALVNISGGHYNVGIGTNVLNAQTASRSVAIGTNAMQYASANYCVAIGHEALMGDSENNSSSQYNTAVGYLTLKASTTGDKNVALGMNAGTAVTSGSSNIFIGNSAGYAHTTDSDTLYIANEAAQYAGTIIKGDMSNKFLAIGSADVTLATADATLQIFPKGTDDTALYVKQVGSSTGSLILMENSSGTDQFVVSSAGAITTGSYTATAIATAYIADDAITLAKMAGLVRGKIIYGDASGNPAALAISSTDGHVLKSDGTDISWGAVTATVSGNVFATDLKVGRDAHNLIDFTTDDNIIFRAGNEDQLTLVDGALTPSSNAIVDLGTDALEFKDGYFDGTLEADAITIGGTNVVTGSLITTLGTISAGVWNGTAIATAYIADDAVTGAKIALFDDSLAATTTHFLIADGTDYSSFALSGDVTCTNAGVVSIADDVISSAELADACTAVTSFTAPLIEGSTSVQTPLIEYTDGDNAIAIADGGSVTFSAATKPAAPAAASGTSGIVVLDCNTTNHFTITTSGNITGWNFTNATVGQRIIVRVTNGASHTIAFSATGDGDVVYFPGGTEPTLTTSSGIDVYGFLCVASDTFDGFVLGQDIKA